ncbi:MAG: DNA polymerase III subunit delta' [Actinomycetota bacterium]
MNVWTGLEESRTVAGLARQISSGASTHAWLLAGPAGSGKLSAATAMAAALNCRERPGEGCGRCSACARILRRSHPDVHHIAPEGPLIAVDVIREQVNPEAARSPFEGLMKVFVIEEADRMNPAAQNSLLKTLEEPQPDTVFILITDNEEEVLETLRSRCRMVRLEPVSEGRIAAVVERDGAPPKLAEQAAKLSSGHLEKARALAFDPAVMRRRAAWAEVPAHLTSAASALGAAAEVLEDAKQAVREQERAQKAEVMELAEAMGEGRGTATARNALAKRHRRELKRLEEEVLGEALAFLASFYRDVVALRSGATKGVTNTDLTEQLALWAESDVSSGALLAAAERALAARATFVNNANVALAIESTLVELTRLVPPPLPARADA